LAVGATGAKWLNPIAEKLISRLMGLLLAALAVQFILNAFQSDGNILGGFTGQ
jgi:multiple antibiotic resistance protein